MAIKTQTTPASGMPAAAPDPKPLPPSSPLGIPVSCADPGLAADFYKELTNKLSWAIGSAYKRSYHSKKGPVRDFAWQLTKRIVQMQGLPEHHEIK